MERYKYAGRYFWFDPDKAPEGAEPVAKKAAELDDKSAQPKNKAAKRKRKA